MLSVNNAQHETKCWKLSKSDARLKATGRYVHEIDTSGRDGQEEEAQARKETSVMLL